MNSLQAFNYRPQRKLRKGYVVTPVCHSVQGGMSASVYVGIHIPWTDTPQADPLGQTPRGQTPPWADPLPPGRHPLGLTPPWADTPGQIPAAPTPPPPPPPSDGYCCRWYASILVIFTRCKWDKVRCGVCVCTCNICAPCVRVWECVCVSGLPLRL